MNVASEKRLKALMPEFATKIRLLVERVSKRGYQVEITQGLRTFAEQDALYAQGRTRKGPKVTNAKSGQSLHNYGLAADFALMKGSKYVWPDPHPVWQVIAEEAKTLGLEAGYYWQHPDKPHVEVAGLGWRELLSAYKKQGIDGAWKLAEPKLTA